MRAAAYPRLVGDVGGTHARFARIEQAGEDIASVATFAAGDYSGLDAVISRYLEAQGQPPPASCAIGIATPITGDAVAMTNRDWSFSIVDLQRRLHLKRLVVLNDFEALALSLPTLTQRELRPVGGSAVRAIDDAPCALLGAGTGLGVSGLLPASGRRGAIVGEGGHASLGAADASEDRLLAVLRERFGHVSAERVLSGSGLENLYRALCAIAGRRAEPLDAAAITSRALQGSDAGCVETVERFFAFLGSVAGNLALTLGARGGVYVGGGIVPQLGDWIDRSRFRERFEAKGRFRAYLAAIPTWLVTDSSTAALRGANRALDA